MWSVLLLTLSAAPVGTRVDVVFGGDVIPHDAVKETAAKLGWPHVFQPLAPSFADADLAVVNLETPLSDDTRAVTEELVFNAPSSLAAGLKASGVSIATFANNHCLDQHREGIVETRDHLRDAGVLSTGADATEADAWQPLVVEKNGMTLCFFAFTRFLNGFHNAPKASAPHVPIVHPANDVKMGGISEAQAVAKVKALSAQCDALVVTPHWGDEYQPKPNLRERRFAWAMLDAGATAIVGTHPHVLQPIEHYARADGRIGLTAYSLGNLVSNQGADDADSPKRDGLLLKLTFEQTEAGVTVAAARAIPLAIGNRVEPKKKRNLQPMLVDDERAQLTSRLSALESKKDRVSRSEKASLARRLKVSERRRERILSAMPVETYGDAPAPLAETVRVVPAR